MNWWMWLILGLALLAGELVTPGGFFVIFFAFSALVVALLVGLGAGGPVWLQGVVFVILAVGSLLMFRRRLLARFRPGDDMSRSLGDVVGGVALVQEDIPPGGFGKGEYRGSLWSVKNVGARPAAKGCRCRVERVDGITLFIVPE
ncbi:MAG: NfeD family protein [Elusimicrobia bacterium]|nr:NfeD family protein [Elusimicrobiota bacterium]